MRKKVGKSSKSKKTARITLLVIRAALHGSILNVDLAIGCIDFDLRVVLVSCIFKEDLLLRVSVIHRNECQILSLVLVGIVAHVKAVKHARHSQIQV